MRKVVIEVQGGVAEVSQCPDDVEVKIIDHDNEEDEHSMDCERCGRQSDALTGGICNDCLE